MTKVTCDSGVSLDGFSAGPDQSRENPLGKGAERMHRWMFEQPEANKAERDAIVEAGAYIMGRHMFGPDRGRVGPGLAGLVGRRSRRTTRPVFVLDAPRRARRSRCRAGRPSTSSPTASRRPSSGRREAAGDQDSVDRAAAPARVQQYLRAGPHRRARGCTSRRSSSAAGERLLDGVGDLELEQLAVTSSELVTHITYRVG